MSVDQPEAPRPGPSADDQANDYMNMFAQVWVKLEVDEEEPEQSEVTREVRVSTTRQRSKGSKKRKYTKPSVTLECDKCDYKTCYKPSLKYHMMGHYGAKPYACAHCDYTTKYPMSLKRHTIIQHECKNQPDKINELATYRCTTCPYTTHFKWNLNSHERKHFLEKKFQCPHCTYSTAYKHNFIKHSRTHSKHDSTYQCDKCPFTTKYEGHITRHLAKVHFEISEKASRCEHCSFSTKTKWRLNMHVNRSRQDKVLKCAHCEYHTNYHCAYREHRISHRDSVMAHSGDRWMKSFVKDNEQSFSSVQNDDQELEFKKLCEIKTKMDLDTGNANVDSISNYDEIKSKLDNDSYYTLNVGKETVPQTDTQIDRQTEHERNHHYQVDPTCEVQWSNIQVTESRDTERPFQCVRCGYRAKFKASVQRHYQRHHTSQIRPYQCVNCDFSTKTKDQISLHNKRSKTNYIIYCTLCPFTTHFKCQYAMHEKAHDPFKCVYCEYTCKKKYDMQKHFTAVHLGNGLKCSYCDFKASRKESLLCHEAIHTGNKPFKCKLCSYTSVRRSLLENHVQRMHSRDIEETVLLDGKVESLRKKDVHLEMGNTSTEIEVTLARMHSEPSEPSEPINPLQYTS